MDGDVVSSNGGDEYVLECDIMLDFSCQDGCIQKMV